MGAGKMEVTIPVNGEKVSGNLSVPENAIGMVVFAHGSGSSRFSPRNRLVAEALQKKGMATLLMGLLTKEEEIEDELTAQFRFDISLLAKRLEAATRWLKENAKTKKLQAAYFGASTGTAAALAAAAGNNEIRAIVSRGGRPDLAGEALNKVKAPTLLIVGGDDDIVIELNKAAMQKMPCEKKLEIIQGATHLFEEPGKLEKVAELAAEWLGKHFLTK